MNVLEYLSIGGVEVGSHTVGFLMLIDLSAEIR